VSSPVRDQYLRLKKQFPHAIMFFRLGDFYEMFDDDAVVGSRELGLHLTKRDFSKGERSPMCGVPYHSAETHLTRLVQRGYKVAICEQIGDPRTSKGIVDREVVRVVTPGTAVEPGLVEAKRNRYLAAVVLKNDDAGIAYADVTTGEITTLALHGRTVGLLVERELSRISAAEVLTPLAEQGDMPAFNAGDAFVTPFEARYFSLAVASRAIANFYDLRSLDGQPYAGSALAIGAAGALLEYLKQTQGSPNQTQGSLLSQLRPITVYAPENYMVLDGPTRRNLEIDQTLRGVAEGSLLSVLDRTQSAMGARLLRRWVGTPLLQLVPLRARQDALAALVADTQLRHTLGNALKSLPDLERLSGKVLQNTALPRDLIALRTTLTRAEALRETLQARGLPLAPPMEDDPTVSPDLGPSLVALAALLDGCADVCDLIAAALVDEPPAQLKDGRYIRPGYSPDLDSIEDAVKEARQWMASLEKVERDRTGIRSLKVEYNKVFGWYIEISHANQALVPADYIRKQTLVGAERYITPELKEKEALVLSADERRAAIESGLLASLRAQIAAQAPRLQKTATALASLDVYGSLAAVAVERGYVRPTLDESTRLEIVDGRHPVVEATQRETPFVPNSVTLDAQSEQILILTGPNMSGKSCFLRQTALIALLAQIGSYVPAAHAHVGLVDRVFTRVGAQDDIATGRSTFMVEMVETATILNSCTPRSLLVLDEIGRGTSTYDGVAIAQAIVEHLHDTPRRAARTIFATHYHELNALADLLPRVRNARMSVLEEGDEVVFLRKVVAGGADKSYGIHVAMLAGLPKDVVRRARHILRELEQKSARDREALDALQLSFFTAPIDQLPIDLAPAPLLIGTGPRMGTPLPDADQVPSSKPSLTPALADLVADLAALDVDDLSPRQALSALADLQARAREHHVPGRS